MKFDFFSNLIDNGNQSINLWQDQQTMVYEDQQWYQFLLTRMFNVIVWSLPVFWAIINSVWSSRIIDLKNFSYYYLICYLDQSF